MFCDRCLVDIADGETLNHAIYHIEKMEDHIMSALQDTLNGFGQQLSAQAATLTTDAGTIQGELAGSVDLTELNKGLSDLSAALATVTALVPAPAPAPVPASDVAPGEAAPPVE